jgi:hypothetical protein
MASNSESPIGAARRAGKQGGLSIIAFLFVVVVALIFTVVGFRVLPAYMEYFSVKGALEQCLVETRDFSSPAEVRRCFQKRADAGYIESVGGRDIELTKVGNSFVASLAWTRKLHLVGNVYLVIEFDTKALR